jgi:hypothetical protein
MKQVLQLLDIPIPILFNDYRDPYSSKNSKGSVQTAYNLFSLIDPIQNFSLMFSQTSSSFIDIYSSIIESAIPRDDAAIKAFAKAKKKLDTKDFQPLALGGERFYLIETNPYQWWDSNPVYSTLQLGNPESDCDYVLPGSVPGMDIALKSNKIAKYDPVKKVNSVCFKCWPVQIIRPWYEPSVFTSTWSMPGYEKGGISKAAFTDENCILPLIPAKCLISLNPLEDISWQKTARPHARTVVPQAEVVTRSYIVAMISDLIPLAPRRD